MSENVSVEKCETFTERQEQGQSYYDSPFCDVTYRKYYHLLLKKVCRVAANRLLKVTRIKIPGDVLTLSDISNERSFRFKVTNITTFGKLYKETGIASRRPKSRRPPIQNKTRKYHFIFNLHPDDVIYCLKFACVKD